MTKHQKQVEPKMVPATKRRLLRKLSITFAVLVLFIVIFVLAVLGYNNISISSDESFARQIDTSIENALAWAEDNRSTILMRKNVALLKMLKEVEPLKDTSVISLFIEDYMNSQIRPFCWKRLVDPNWPVDRTEINKVIEKEPLDNKWILFAIAPDKVKITPDEMGLFEPDKWQWRKLTHQLDALICLRKNQGPSPKVNELIEHLSKRISRQLVYDVPVVDIYIQKVTFILRAGYPEKIRRRWIERIIENQREDGGWNDRWFCFESRRRPIFKKPVPMSDQHATLQAITALYLVRYKYPEHFGVK